MSASVPRHCPYPQETIVSGLPPIPVNATVIDLRTIAAIHEVPIVYVLDEYLRQHQYQHQESAPSDRAAWWWPGQAPAR